MLDDPSMEISFIALDLDILHPCYNDVKCVFPLQEVVESKAVVMTISLRLHGMWR